MQHIILLTLILLMSATSLAQETEQPETAQTDSEQTAQSAAADEQQNQSADEDANATAPDGDAPQASDEDFVPSQQISEDLSVSFPVDI